MQITLKLELPSTSLKWELCRWAALEQSLPKLNPEYEDLNTNSFSLPVCFYLTAIFAYELIAGNSTSISYEIKDKIFPSCPVV